MKQHLINHTLFLPNETTLKTKLRKLLTEQRARNYVPTTNLI